MHLHLGSLRPRLDASTQSLNLVKRRKIRQLLFGQNPALSFCELGTILERPRSDKAFEGLVLSQKLVERILTRRLGLGLPFQRLDTIENGLDIAAAGQV